MASQSKSTTARSTRSRTVKADEQAPAPSLPAAKGRTARAKTPSTAGPPTKPAPGKRAISKPPSREIKHDSEPSRPASRKAGSILQTIVDVDREPITAYLRIRPRLSSERGSSPYLEPLSDTSVQMTDPSAHSQISQPNRYRPSVPPSSSIYTFSHVFDPLTSQSDFFTRTTLPLVSDLLSGQSSLLFTYGVTNSGKTYTIQGGGAEGSAGILPRTLDVIFNSIDGLQSDGRYRPVRLCGIEPIDTQEPSIADNDVISQPALAEILTEETLATSADVDHTVLKVDRNYEYGVWVSYAEVYNEKAYDLLETVNGTVVEGSQPLLLTRKALAVKSSPPSDSENGEGRYIAGLKHVRVTSAAQAKAIVSLGQAHRRVFGTLANSVSSRSHGLVTIKLVRGHRGERDDPTALQVSRLTLVDLAGSERTKHTQTTGDRLREAGNINKSLMVLGQCMEVMRNNQRRVAQILNSFNKERTDTREVKKAIVPFRHSRLTEVLMDYFVSDGRVVMIVNVNPYDTGYDENSHVMKFSALAREIHTTPAAAPMQRVPSPTKPSAASKKAALPTSKTSRGSEPIPHRRKVTVSMGGPGKKFSETHLEVLEEDEDASDLDDSDIPINPLVDALFDEVEELRLQLYEARLVTADAEEKTRRDVMEMMQERMNNMEQMYLKRLALEREQSERKADAKIDLLQKTGIFASPMKGQQRTHAEDDDDEEMADVEASLIAPGEGSSEDSMAIDDDHSPSEAATSPSPLARKIQRSKFPSTQAKRTAEPHEHEDHGSNGEEGSSNPVSDEEESDHEDGEDEEGDENEDENEDEDDSDETESDEEATGSEFNVDESEEGESEDDYIPKRRSSGGRKSQSGKGPSRGADTTSKLKAKAQSSVTKKPPRILSGAAIAPNTRDSKRHSGRGDMNHIERDIAELAVDDDDMNDDSLVILPNKSVPKPLAQAGGEPSSVSVSNDNGAKKKKRQLGKNAVVNEEEIVRATERASRGQAQNRIRRLTQK